MNSWDQLKTTLKIECIEASKKSNTREKERIKQKRKRLLKTLHQTRAHMYDKPRADISEMMNALSLNETPTIQGIHAKLADLEIIRQDSARNKSFHAYQLGSQQEAKKFFARFSTKFGPIQPMSLGSVPKGAE